MKIHCTMYLPPKKKVEYGHITVSGQGITLARKSKFLLFGFGALGALLAQPSDFHDFLWKDVSRIEMKKYRFAKKACYITLKNEKEYIFLLPKPNETIASLKDIYKISKEMKVSSLSLFKD